MLKDRILFVDDDKNVLDTYRRLLHDKMCVETAAGGETALKLIDATEPFAVVVSDLRMPSMDGVQFLSRVKDKYPDTVRILLTGNADLETAIDAVNDGNIFRLLTKPCTAQVMLKALIAGIDQYRLATNKKELLKKALKDSIRPLTDILALADPEIFGRASKYQEALRMIAQKLHVTNVWDLEMAWMFSNLSHVLLPPKTLGNLRAGRRLTDEEKRLVARAPESICRLLSDIPEFDNVVRIIKYQNKHFDGSGFPKTGTKGKMIPIESRIVKLLADLAQLETSSRSKTDILKMMMNRGGWYDPEVLEATLEVFAPGLDRSCPVYIQHSFKVSELRNGDTLVTDLLTKDGQLLAAGGMAISDVCLERVNNFARYVGVKEPVLVKRPIRSEGKKLAKAAIH